MLPRLSQRLATALVWLAIALLPIRGWAFAAMPAAPANAEVAAALHMSGDSGAGETSADAAAPPCHAGGFGGAADSDDGGSSSSAATCGLCSLCHFGVAAFPTAAAHADAPPAVAPSWASASPVVDRAPDALYRPPRLG